MASNHRYPHILAAIRSAKWAVNPETLHSIRDVLSARLAGNLSPRADDWDGDDDDNDEVKPYEMATPGVAIVEMHGILGKNLSSLEMMCGGCDVGEVEERLAYAMADPAVATVVLDIDSPGGTAAGIIELTQAIDKMSSESGKPVWAYIDGMGCSAAYWVSCACAGIACSPSADVGSIGVYMAMIDESENWSKEGYRLVLIKAGEYKAAGIPGSQVTTEQVKVWQADVDVIYSQFTSAVKAARPGIKHEAMQGQSFYGPRALEAGLVDQLMSRDELVAMVAPRVIAPKSLPLPGY